MDSEGNRGGMMKPTFDVVRAFEMFMETESKGELKQKLQQYLDKLNSQLEVENSKFTEPVKMSDLKAYPDSALYDFLFRKSNAQRETKERFLNNGILQGRFTTNVDGSYRTSDEVQSLLIKELDSKYPNLTGISSSKKAKLISTLMNTAAPKEDSQASTTTSSSTQVIDEAKNDTKLNSILGMFEVNSRPADYRVFEVYFEQFASKKKVRRAISWSNYVKRNYKPSLKIDNILDSIKILETSIPAYFKAIMQPFKMILKDLVDTKEQGKGRYSISTLRASDFIGRLDMKSTKKREEIYSYWDDIKDKHSEFSSAHNSFVSAIGKLDTSGLPELETKMKKFSKFDVDKLQYIKLYDSVKIEDVADVEQKAIFILRDFLKSIGNLPEEKFIYTEGKRSRDDVPKWNELEQGEQKITEEDEEEGLKDQINSLIKIRVDPLYGYALGLGEEAGLPAGAVIDKEIEELESRLKTGLVLVEMDNLIPSLQKYMENLKKFKSKITSDYYLPVIPTLQGYSGEDVNKEVAEYLTLFAEFIEFGSDFERRSKGSASGVSRDRISIGRAGAGKTHLTDFKTLDINDKFTELLQAIVEYFIEPSRNQNRPLDEELPFISQVGSRPIENIAREPDAGNSPFIHLLRMESNDWTLTKSQLTEIADYMKLLTSLNIGSKQTELFEKTTDLADMIDDIFEGEMSEQINIEFGNFLSLIFKEANLNDKKFGVGGSGKKLTAELAADYKSQKIYPFESIFNHLIMKKQSYLDPKTGVDGAAKLLNTINQAEADLKITKAKEEVILLQAHDEIRKMLGKPLFYGLSNVHDFTAVSTAIEHMNTQYKTDITATDVENVVKEFDSMSNVGVKYGIPEEGVYFLKANFR